MASKPVWEMTPRQAIKYWAGQWAKLTGRAASDNPAIAGDAKLALIEVEASLTDLNAVRDGDSWKLGPIDRATFLPAIRSHALAHYEEGWDVVIETMTDVEILEEIKWCESPAGAIRKLGEGVRIRHSVYLDICATAF
jgi:hypothetical protein